MTSNSAIFQMLMGTHGEIETVVHSTDYNEAYNKFYEKFDAFTKKIADNKEIVAMFDEMDSALDEVTAFGETDFYMAGFSFGVLMGIDVMRINAMKN